MNIIRFLIKYPSCPKCKSNKYVEYLHKEIKNAKIEKDKAETIGNGINQLCKIASQFEKLNGLGQPICMLTKLLGAASSEVVYELGKTKLIKHFKCSKCQKEFKIIKYLT